jgi:hypothetical protein
MPADCRRPSRLHIKSHLHRKTGTDASLGVEVSSTYVHTHIMHAEHNATSMAHYTCGHNVAHTRTHIHAPLAQVCLQTTQTARTRMSTPHPGGAGSPTSPFSSSAEGSSILPSSTRTCTQPLFAPPATATTDPLTHDSSACGTQGQTQRTGHRKHQYRSQGPSTVAHRDIRTRWERRYFAHADTCTYAQGGNADACTRTHGGIDACQHAHRNEDAPASFTSTGQPR